MDRSYRDSLVRRLRAVHSLYEDACASMSLDHVNALAHPDGLPIAFCLAHQVLIEDVSLAFAGGPAPRYDDHWRRALALGVDDDGKTRSVEEMRVQSIGDYDAFREFQALVFRATEEHVAGLDPSCFDDVLVTPPYPPSLASTYSARVGGEAGITRSDAFESWIYQHALRHMGEIEILRSLVGLQGMTS